MRSNVLLQVACPRHDWRPSPDDALLLVCAACGAEQEEVDDGRHAAENHAAENEAAAPPRVSATVSRWRPRPDWELIDELAAADRLVRAWSGPLAFADDEAAENAVRPNALPPRERWPQANRAAGENAAAHENAAADANPTLGDSPRRDAKSIRTARSTGGAELGLGWSLLSLGAMALACGAVLLAFARFGGRDDLWAYGLPLALGGQGALIVGLVCQLAARRPESVGGEDAGLNH